jgi:hypothetical protein
MKTIKKFSLFFTLALSVIACNKKEKAEVDIETQTSVDNSIAEQAFVEVVPVVNQIGVNEPGVNKTDSNTVDFSCAKYTITGDTANFPGAGPVTITIDYGTAGCMDNDGRVRKGKIIAVFNNKWNVNGATANITLENYSVGNINYSGTMLLTRNNATTLSYVVSNGKCTDGTFTILFECNKTIEKIQGASTDTIWIDDVYKFTGTSSGVNRNGRSYTTKIVEPLIKKNNCKWIDTGVIEITPEGLSTRTVNFGNGTCDDKATVTINGNTYNFVLR